MKIGIFTDVHNNVRALEAILQKFEEEGCSELICCGDLNGIGPWPEETLRLASTLKNFHCVLGNHELLLERGLDPIPEGMGEGEARQHEWEFGLLSEAEKDFILALPKTLFLEREGVKIAVLHYSMDEEGRFENYTPSPSLEDCQKMFPDTDADVICYGHDHSGAVTGNDKKLYVNCGSLGCPGTLGGIARGGILTVDSGHFSYKPTAVSYELNAVIEKINSIQYPDFEIVKKIFYGIN